MHACAPFYHDERWRALLLSCFTNALNVADVQGAKSVAVPLLGAGARGAPFAEVATVAAQAMYEWKGRGALREARFAVQDDEVAEAVATAMDAVLHVVDEPCTDDGDASSARAPMRSSRRRSMFD